MKESYWAKVLFREFTSHYIEMTKDEKAEDVEQSIIALTKLDSSGSSFGSKMVGWANERMNQKAAAASRDNGKLGGRPSKATAAESAEGWEPMPNTDLLYTFATNNGLDHGICREWYEMSKERGWKMKDGTAITNWRGCLKRYHSARMKNFNKED